ncbi:hypothetical protein Tco_0013783 [Tanacetum coccineum]
MEVDIEEDENEPELTYPYEEVDPLNPLLLLLSQNLRMRSRTVMVYCMVSWEGTLTLFLVRWLLFQENVILDKSSSQPQSSYEAAMSPTKFEFKKILLDKMKKSKSYRGAQEYRDLYDGLVKSYKLDKDLFEY